MVQHNFKKLLESPPPEGEMYGSFWKIQHIGVGAKEQNTENHDSVFGRSRVN